MKAELKNLYDQKGRTWAQMRDVARKLKEGKELTAEENTQFDAWDAEMKSVTDKIKKIERADQLEAELALENLRSVPGSGEPEEVINARQRERDLTYRKGLVRGFDNLSDKERKLFNQMEAETRAFEKYLRGEIMDEQETKIMAGLRNSARSLELGQRAQSTSATAGGYSIPQGFLAMIDEQLKLISPFFEENNAAPTAIAKSIFGFVQTDAGNDLPFPTNNDTGNVGELLGENTDAFTNSVDAVLGQVIYKAWKYSSKPMKVSNELLNDTGVDLPTFLAELLATRIARIVNTHFTTGDNSSKPQGIVTGATAGKTTASATAITFPEIIDLTHSVDAAYRKSASCRFMFNDLILAYLKKLTIGSATNDSRPVWKPGFSTGAPDTIDGFRYLVNNDMASTLATTNITMLFGDMSKYGIRQVRNMVFRRLDERFADADQTAWLMFMRIDGRYKNTAAIKKMTQV